MATKSNGLIWKCLGCEFTAPGTASGYSNVLNHLKKLKAAGKDGHDYCLADIQTGKSLTDDLGAPIKSPSRAQALGFIPGKPGRKSRNTKVEKVEVSNDETGKTIKGKTRQLEFEVDGKLLLLYNWDISTMDWKGSFSEWLTDCIMGFHIQNKDALKLEKLFAGVK